MGLGRCRGSGWLGAHGRFFLLLLILPTPPVGAARTGRAVGCGDLGCVCVIWGVCVILGCDSWHGNVAFGPYRRPRAPRPQQRQGEAAASPAALPKLSLRIWSPETASGGIPASGEILAASSDPRPRKEAGSCYWPPEWHTASCTMLNAEFGTSTSLHEERGLIDLLPNCLFSHHSTSLCTSYLTR